MRSLLNACIVTKRKKLLLMSRYHYVETMQLIFLFHRLTRTAYLYNGCLAWYNVVMTSRVHSSVKYSQRSLARATVE